MHLEMVLWLQYIVRRYSYQRTLSNNIISELYCQMISPDDVVGAYCWKIGCRILSAELLDDLVGGHC